MQASKPLNRRIAIILAWAALWLVAWVGVFVLIHSYDWWFIDLHGYDWITIGQIGTFYLAWTGAQLPAACIAGMAIASSDFRHPVWTTLLTTAVYYSVHSVIIAFHWPWPAFHDLDQSIPVLAYTVSILSLILFSAFVAWFMPRFDRFFQKCFAH